MHVFKSLAQVLEVLVQIWIGPKTRLSPLGVNLGTIKNPVWLQVHVAVHIGASSVGGLIMRQKCQPE